MARVKFYLDKKPTKDGKCHIKLTLTHNGGSALLSTGVFVKPEFWYGGDSETEPHIKKTCAGHKALNAILAEKFEDVQNKINALVRDGTLNSFSTATHLKNHIQGIIDGNTDGRSLVEGHFENFISRRNKPGTAGVYRETLVKISKYHDIGKVKFEDITVAWLKDFENQLRKDGLTVNSIAIHLRNIRAVYNDAIDYEVVSLAAYPFRRFKITHEATAKRSLTLEQFRQLRDYTCEPHQEKYRDLFMLIFYLGGINIVDLLQVKTITNGRIEYRRAKTSMLYSIKVEQEAQILIDKYRGEKQLLDPLDRYSNYKDFLHRMNKNLQEIGTTEIVARSNGRLGKKEKTGVFCGLSSYWARHTLATLMAEIDIPMETISKVLGHSNGKNVTAVYVKFDQRKIDEAMRRVIDYVNG